MSTQSTYAVILIIVVGYFQETYIQKTDCIENFY